MKIGLFIPCYVDQFYPKVAIATLELLEKMGFDVGYPLDQTCCGQPMANSGYDAKTGKIKELFVQNFSEYDCIVTPSGSCALHVKEHFSDIQSSEALHVRSSIYELSEFLHEHSAKLPSFTSFPYKVGVHSSCHGLRGLRIGRSTELNIPEFDKVKSLLGQVPGIQLAGLNKSDECCGFGGTFAVMEEALSVKMGRDRLNDHKSQHVEVMTGTDMSCLMHLEGIARRNKEPIKFMHFSQILNGNQP